MRLEVSFTTVSQVDKQSIKASMTQCVCNFPCKVDIIAMATKGKCDKFATDTYSS